MALAIGVQKSRFKKWHARPWGTKSMAETSLEKIVDVIYSIRPVPRPVPAIDSEAKIKVDPQESVWGFNDPHNSIEEIVGGNHTGFFGRVVNRVYEAVSRGLDYFGKEVFSFMPARVRYRVAMGSLTGLLVLTACSTNATPTPLPSPTPTPTPTPTINLEYTKIAFSKNGDIFTMNGDGENVIQLTSARCSDLNPVWSPNGDKIAFESYRNGDADIYVMNAGGSNQIGLALGSTEDLSPTWSPDGKKITFSSNREIYVMNADGSNQKFLSSGRYPAWSPRDGKIAFIDDYSGGNALYIMNSDGSGKTLLTQNLGNPVWSPDGKRIAFIASETGVDNIYIINNDGSGRTQLTHDAGKDDRWKYDLTWSYNSNYLAFTQRRVVFDKVGDWRGASYGTYHDEFAAFVVAADGSGGDTARYYRRGELIPVWSPHGNVLAVAFEGDYRGYISNESGIYTVNSNGDNWTLRNAFTFNRNRFSWSPRLYQNAQGLENVIAKDQPPDYITNNPHAYSAYTQASSILGSKELTTQDKQKELRVLQKTVGEELFTQVIRHVPVYDEKSGGFVSFDAYMRSMSNDFGAFSGAPMESDPVGAGMRIYFDPSPETIKAMAGLDNWLKAQPKKFECKK